MHRWAGAATHDATATRRAGCSVRKDISRENNAVDGGCAVERGNANNINRLDNASRERISQATIEANNLISNRQIEASEQETSRTP